MYVMPSDITRRPKLSDNIDIPTAWLGYSYSEMGGRAPYECSEMTSRWWMTAIVVVVVRLFAVPNMSGGRGFKNVRINAISMTLRKKTKLKLFLSIQDKTMTKRRCTYWMSDDKKYKVLREYPFPMNRFSLRAEWERPESCLARCSAWAWAFLYTFIFPK